MDNKNFNFPDDKIFQYITYGIVLAFILFNLESVWDFFLNALGLARPFYIAIVIAFVINIPMKLVEKLLVKAREQLTKKKPNLKLPQFLVEGTRGIAMAITIICLLLILVMFFSFIIPRIGESFSLLFSNLDNNSLNEDDSSNCYITFNFDSGYYSDLFIKQFDSKLDLSDKGYAFNVGKMLFKKSELAFEVDANNELEILRIKVFAPQFDISELNSNLTDHLLSGVINIEGEITKLEEIDEKTDKTSAPMGGATTDKGNNSENNNTNSHISNINNEKNKVDNNNVYKAKQLYTGNINLTSDSLLVSQFGLDLINGGLKKNYALNYDELCDNFQSSACSLPPLPITKTFIRSSSLSYGGNDDVR